VVYRVTDPVSGGARRMTTREKKELKHRMKTEARTAIREEKRRLHEERIREAKRGRAERLKSKNAARRRQKMAAGERRPETKEEEEEEEEEDAKTNDGTTEDADEGDAKTTSGSAIHPRPSLVPGRGDVNAMIATPNDRTSAAATGSRDAAGDRDGGKGSSSMSSTAPIVVAPSIVVAGGRRCVPPAMLTPAATLVAADLGLLPPPSSSSPSPSRRRHRRDGTTTSTATLMDPALSAEWARRLGESMIPAETARAGEDMRPMAYRLVPEPWRRLCPDTLWTTEGGGGGGAAVGGGGGRCGAGPEGEEEEEGGAPGGDEDDAVGVATACSSALVRVRDLSSSSTYDEDAYAVVGHLHRNSRIHVACGAAFGCDFLLYDGRREERHSFAGLRVYGSRRRRGDDDGRRPDASDTSKEGAAAQFPTPSAYDLTGFVRTMNTARKIALVAMVVRGGGRGGSDRGDGGDDAMAQPNTRIAIVDLALEKVLTALAHVRKGSTMKRRTEEDAASGLARKR
jgi:hypothetical protein